MVTTLCGELRPSSTTRRRIHDAAAQLRDLGGLLGLIDVDLVVMGGGHPASRTVVVVHVPHRRASRRS